MKTIKEITDEFNQNYYKICNSDYKRSALELKNGSVLIIINKEEKETDREIICFNNTKELEKNLMAFWKLEMILDEIIYSDHSEDHSSFLYKAYKGDKKIFGKTEKITMEDFYQIQSELEIPGLVNMFYRNFLKENDIFFQIHTFFELGKSNEWKKITQEIPGDDLYGMTITDRTSEKSEKFNPGIIFDMVNLGCSIDWEQNSLYGIDFEIVDRVNDISVYTDTLYKSESSKLHWELMMIYSVIDKFKGNLIKNKIDYNIIDERILENLSSITETEKSPVWIINMIKDIKDEIFNILDEILEEYENNN